MKAVNLIPVEDRRGAGGAVGRSGGVAYVLIGALALIVILAGAYAESSKQVRDKKSQISGLSKQAAAAEARATELQGYTAFATLSGNRVTTVTDIANGRYDWAHLMHEVARTVPAGVTLTNLSGTLTADPAAAATAATAGAAATPSGPTVTITGCAPGNQDATARLLVSLRRIDGVQDVSLKSSTKGDATATTGGSSSSSAADGGCDGPTFSVTATFATPGASSAATSAAGAATGATGATGATTPTTTTTGSTS